MPQRIRLGTVTNGTLDTLAGTIEIDNGDIYIVAENGDIRTDGNITFEDATADPTANGELQRNGADLKAFSGGAVRSLSNIGSGVWETVTGAIRPDTADTDVIPNGNGSLGTSSDPWPAVTTDQINTADATTALEGERLVKTGSGTDLEFSTVSIGELVDFGLIYESITSTTISSSGTITYEHDRIELREPGDGASQRFTRFYNNGAGFDPSDSGTVRVNLSNISVDNNSTARIYVVLTDMPDGDGSAGDDTLAPHIRGGGTVLAETSDDGSAGSTLDSSQDNTFVNNLNYIEISYDGSTLTVEASDGSSTVTVSDSSNYPSGENLFLKIEAADADGSNARNVDFDVAGIEVS